MSSRIEAVNEAVAANIAGFRPAGRSEVEDWFAALPDMLRGMGKAFATAADNIEDMHIHRHVVEMLRELGQVVTSSAGTAEDTYQRHSREHQVWLTD